MKTPLDCQLLTLGLKYVVARSENDLEKVFSYLDSEISADLSLWLREHTPRSRNQMKNLFFIHADVTNANDPKVVLKFPRNHVEVLHVTSDEESAKIRDIEAWDLKFGDQSTPSDAELVDSGSLSLLSVAVPYSIADAVVDLSFQPQHMTEDMTAFGLKGKEAILKHSAEFLTPQKLLGRPAYALSDPFVADPVKRMVTLGFECLIEGFEGKGTDYLHFDNDNKIYQLVAVRHTGTFDPCKHT